LSKKVSAEIRLRNKSPQAREQHANNLIVEYLDRNPNGVTVKQIVTTTGISRITVVRHLERLVAYRKAKKRDFGYVSIYSKGGYFDEETCKSESFSDGTSFTLQLVNREPDGNYIYIQEKQLGDFREEKVTGGIMVKVEDTKKFATMFHTFAAQVVDLESNK